MKLSALLKERGYVYQHSSETIEEITEGKIHTLYLGVDPTADSMHVGQLMGVLVLRRFVEAGHKLIVLVGGGTGMIGDPGGKSAERNLLDNETVRRNADALKTQFKHLLGGVDFEMVNNAEWLHTLNYMEFLRDIGKHFTVNEMIKRDTVRPRLETPDQSISYTEFSYMLLQAYDFLELNKRFDCDLQVGGSDQWGNIISGVELIRRKTGNKAYALSWPLLVDKAGKKFGKSEGNAVWLEAKKTSAFQFYQFWYNVEDEMVEELLLKMTLVPKQEIETIMSEHDDNPSARVAQQHLARAVTILVHGDEAAHLAEEASDALFGGKDMSALSKKTIAVLSAEAPSCEVRIGEPLADVVVRANLASSKREARQFTEDGAIVLNGAKISDTNRVVMKEDFENAPVALLKRGKRNVCVLISR
jgi:tyrosyl-tRNA synthetase